MAKLNACTAEQLERLKPYLDKWVDRIEQPSYIQDDPVSFMHAFEDKADRTLAGFFAAIMAWGRRDIVLAKVEDLLSRMDHQPAAFIRNFSDDDAARFEGFKHRTFKPVDIFWLTKCLHEIVQLYGSLEAFWEHCYQKANNSGRELIAVFHHEFFGLHDGIPQRTHKHISNSEKDSSCKRLYLYLRWVIRNDSPVDPGIMDFMEPSELMIPLDVHAARQARVLGLLTRTYNDWKATVELTENMRMLDPEDPAKYDYA
ncbi:MAG TPA: TIGR02757 family protein, partial [Balneolaceae bacterium]|nr:TIGR02757 family protein [Balneolaceae bacterium]